MIGPSFGALENLGDGPQPDLEEGPVTEPSWDKWAEADYRFDSAREG